MPLMVGDWLKGTRGMRAETKGVYLGLLLHQYETGFIPSSLEDLALIEPEVAKVWVSLKDKFEEFEPGKLRNKKLVEVVAFWDKQRNNGKKGGKKKEANPNANPKPIPNANPKAYHHNDIDLDSDLELKLKGALDEIYVEQQRTKWRHVSFDFELNSFIEKVRGSPAHYAGHDAGGIRLAFQSQLRGAKHKKNGTNQITTEQRNAYIRAKYGSEGTA